VVGADVGDVVFPVRDRLALSYEGLADDVTPDGLLDEVLAVVPMPDIPMRVRGDAPGGTEWSTRRH
jgi:hypothetical protein